MSNTAILLSKNTPNGVGAVQHHYLLDPPLEGYKYVVVSAVNAFGFMPETYIFPSDEYGGITDWGELPGSFKGDLDHEAALKGAGYTVTGVIEA